MGLVSQLLAFPAKRDELVLNEAGLHFLRPDVVRLTAGSDQRVAGSGCSQLSVKSRDDVGPHPVLADGDVLASLREPELPEIRDATNDSRAANH